MDTSIGIIDSGIGGLTIWKELIKELPLESTTYLADSKNCPYGERPVQEIYDLSLRLVRFLLGERVKLIVIACNTITVTCLDQLRYQFPQLPVVGTVPVVKTASEKTKNRKIGILSTNTTAKSFYQKNLIDTYAKDSTVLNLGTDDLVPFIERGEVGSSEFKDILQETLEPFQKADIDTLALGCTHFSLVKDQMQAILGQSVMLLDSSGAIARQVRQVLMKRNELASNVASKYQFYTTGIPDELYHALTQMIGYTPEKVYQLLL